MLVGPLEHLNLSIIDAISYCSRIRNNLTNGQQTENREQRTKKPITESPLIPDRIAG